MLNPSTANAEMDDPTVRKCQGFATRLGYRRLVIVNLFAFRATKPADLLGVNDPVGPDNDSHIRYAIMTSEIVVVAWGAHRAARSRVADFLRIVGPHQPLSCLGHTKDGSPRHPLMLPYASELVNWKTTNEKGC